MPENIVNYLKNKKDKIYYLLDEAGFRNIKTGGHKIKFAFDDVGGSGSCILDPETLLYTRFSNGTGGRIFDAIMAKKNMNFLSSVNWCKYKLGIGGQSTDEKDLVAIKKPIFNGLFDFEHVQEKYYNMEDLLEKYEPCISQRFLDDNISSEAQIEYQIMYDKVSNRIVILWVNKDGLIVGYNARANFEVYEGYRHKYLSAEGFYKGNHLFGLYKNKEHIRNNICVVVESEKSVMQARTFGFNYIVAIGSSMFTNKQFKLLTDLCVTDIIFMLDEGSSYMENYKPQFDRLSLQNEILPNLWFVYDYAGFKPKSSPTDMGYEFFKDVLENKIKRWER